MNQTALKFKKGDIVLRKCDLERTVKVLNICTILRVDRDGCILSYDNNHPGNCFWYDEELVLLPGKDREEALLSYKLLNL